MDILNSTWFLHMLKKTGKTPRQRLLVMFDLLDDWMVVPSISEQLAEQDQGQTIPSETLLTYLAQQAKASGAQAPEALAQQLYFMASGAIKAQLQLRDKNAFAHAKYAAQALVTAQTAKAPTASRAALYGIAASLMGMVAMVIALVWPNPALRQHMMASEGAAAPAASAQKQLEASPVQTAELYSSIEQMRKGDCQYPEALAFPEKQRAIYLENVIDGQISTKAADQALTRHFMQKVRCNYTPMLMANSVG